MQRRSPLMRCHSCFLAALSCWWLASLWLVAGNPECWTGGVSYESCCDTKYGPEGNKGCWDQQFTYEFCCFDPANTGKPDPIDVNDNNYPACAKSGVVLRHDEAHGIFADMSTHGSSGCFQNDCKLTDKFNAKDKGVCARLCQELDECTHWSFGVQDGAGKCFLRKSDEGRQKAPASWVSGGKACGPPALPHGFVAYAVSESKGIKACDNGKTEACPDVLPAVVTWIYAIKHMRAAAEGRLDPGSIQHIDQIMHDSTNLKNQVNAEYRPSDVDFPRVAYNNRLIFNTLGDWLRQHPAVELSETDVSLPVPLRTGQLCGQTSCWDG